MIIPERLEERLAAKGWSQAELARRVGVKSTSIWKLASGHSQTSKHLHRIASELDTTAEYLLGESDDREARLGDRRRPWRGANTVTARDQDMVLVHQIDLSFGLGSAIADTEIFEDQAERLEFPKAWLRMITSSAPSQLCWARCKGNSMYPTIADGAVILMDRGQCTLRDSDLIWAGSYGQSPIVKRLRPMPDGSVKIISDNPNVPPEIAYDGELSIFGRVIAVVNSL